MGSPEEVALACREVELMAAVGPPPDVELWRLGRFLAWPGDTRSLAALFRLEQQIGIPGRTVLEWMVDERLFLATLLIVALCFFAVFQAPSQRFVTSPTALP